MIYPLDRVIQLLNNWGLAWMSPTTFHYQRLHLWRNTIQQFFPLKISVRVRITLILTVVTLTLHLYRKGLRQITWQNSFFQPLSKCLKQLSLVLNNRIIWSKGSFFLNPFLSCNHLFICMNLIPPGKTSLKNSRFFTFLHILLKTEQFFIN